MLRGISGGQKKRLTTAEMLAGPSKVIFADEISTGLDSSTTYQIVQSFRNFTHTRQVGGLCLAYNSSRKQHYLRRAVLPQVLAHLAAAHDGACCP